jgi:hypothetical protein
MKLPQFIQRWINRRMRARYVIRQVGDTFEIRWKSLKPWKPGRF